MREILDHCSGAVRREVPAGTVVIREGSKTGHLFVLVEGQLEALTGEMSLLLDRPHTATVRTSAPSTFYEIEAAASFLDNEPAVAVLIARVLAQRLNVATTYLADLMHQYAGHGTHLEMVGEILQSMLSLPPRKVSPGSDRQSDPRM